MAILEVCSKCKRLGGYAFEATDKVCARCKTLKPTRSKTEEAVDQLNEEDEE